MSQLVTLVEGPRDGASFEFDDAVTEIHATATGYPDVVFVYQRDEDNPSRAYFSGEVRSTLEFDHDVFANEFRMHCDIQRWTAQRAGTPEPAK